MSTASSGWLGKIIASYLTKPQIGYIPATPPDFDALTRVLRPGDVLLVEGDTRVASIIKYLTQSTWSHAALVVGDCLGKKSPEGEPHVLIEANLNEGVISAPLSKYAQSNTRICRPVALLPADQQRVLSFAIERIGYAYDTKNVLDLMRYLIPMPFPARFRRRMIALGSGEPTRAIC